MYVLVKKTLLVRYHFLRWYQLLYICKSHVPNLINIRLRIRSIFIPRARHWIKVHPSRGPGNLTHHFIIQYLAVYLEGLRANREQLSNLLLRTNKNFWWDPGWRPPLSAIPCSNFRLQIQGQISRWAKIAMSSSTSYDFMTGELQGDKCGRGHRLCWHQNKSCA